MGLQNLLIFSTFVVFLHTNFNCLGKVEQDPFIRYPRETISYVDGQSASLPSYGDRPSASPPANYIKMRSDRTVNVDDYGAKGDGTDDSKAFVEAWKEACSSYNSPTFLVPENKRYLLKPVTFSGPCNSNVSVMIKGRIEASSNRLDWNEENRRHWILFQGINHLTVNGGGTIDGNGQIWWEKSCKVDESLPCTVAPTALTFYSCNNLIVENLMLKNSQQMHLVFEKCSGVTASSLTITAPGKSPNTDGIHVTRTENIEINGCKIGTGDDCISIVTGSQNVKAKNIYCGPGHGISIGSLGADNSEAQVSNVLIDTATLSGTTNGVRIKTWQGGHGYAKNINFQNIAVHAVENPIIINQNYCDSKTPCQEQESAVEISNILYKNIKGTSASEDSIIFNCSKTASCRGILLQDINLVKEGGGETKSLCNNVKYTKKGTVIPPPCV